MTTPLPLAVMGAGTMGRRHAEHIRAARECALCALIDPAPAARELAGAYGVPWFPDLTALLAGDRPAGLVIATPNTLHVEHGLAAVAAGLPMLLEKPIADDLEGGRRLVEAAEAAGVPLLIGHHRRHNGLIGRAKRIIEEGRLGRIVSVHAFFWVMKPDDYFDTHWRREMGAGPVLMNLIHDVDLLRYLCGEIEAVQAFQSKAIRQFPVDETTAVIVRFASGALCTINVSDTAVAPWSWEQTTGENPTFPRTEEACYQIAGTHGALSVPRLELWTNPAKRSWLEPFAVERIVATEEDPLRAQIRQFCAVIRGEAQPLVSGREGLRTLTVIEAIHRAAATGARVIIE